jgi:hypothetical protein
LNTMADKAPKQVAELDDLMLAMDVVDTLRHQQSLVEHALSADDRDAALTARIRKIYLDQGIVVTDEVIANGVRALREERFAYREPPGGMQTWLAKCYVNRGKAYKPIAGIVAAASIWWGAHFAFSTLPEQRALEEAMAQFNSQVVAVQSDTISLKNRLATASALAKKPPQVNAQFSSMVPPVMRETQQALGVASELQGSLSLDDIQSFTDTDDFGDERLEAQAELKRYRASIEQLRSNLATVENNNTLLAALDRMPAQVMELASAAKSIGAEPAVAAIANAENALAALKAGDIKAAEKEKIALENLLVEVKESYQILIVSEPGEKTGLWRYPEDKNSARNYYLVVEAVTSDGRRLSRPVVSEEDGKTHQVKRWAMRVNEKTYNNVDADKGDDGIVQNKLFGEKARGYINPTYRMNTTGASIVSW